MDEWIKKMWYLHKTEYSASSIAQLCLSLCNPMGCSMPGLPAYHQLTEFTQTHFP